MSLRRRDLFRGGAAIGGGALGLALLGRAPKAVAGPSEDREILIEALELERRLEAIYRGLAGGGGTGGRTAELFHEHCREHARGLTIALDNRGGVPGKGPAPLPLGSLAAALEVETAAVGAYYRAASGLGDVPLLPTLTSIMANHGQHLVVLRQSTGRAPATVAFETGDVE
jgi:hypothetical protein